MDIDDFKKIKEPLTESLAAAFEARLREMGDDAKGISYFSSVAHLHPKNIVA